MKKRNKKSAAIIICLFIIMQLMLRMTYFDIMAQNIRVGVIFRDNAGYHIRDISYLINDEGKISLPNPMELGALINDNEIYTNYRPILVEKSLEDMKKLIENKKEIRAEKIQPATPSIATPATATISNAQTEDYDLWSDVSFYGDVKYEPGTFIGIWDKSNQNVFSHEIRDFISKKGGINQIFFFAEPEDNNFTQIIDHEENKPSDIPKTTEKSEDKEDNEPKSNIIIKKNITEKNISGKNINFAKKKKEQKTKSNSEQGKSTDKNTERKSVRVKKEPEKREKDAPPIIHADMVNNKVNGFLNTGNTSVTIEDENFVQKDYSVSVYKIVNGKEILSNIKYSWSANGNKHTANFSFENDGEYRISVVKKSGAKSGSKTVTGLNEKVSIDTTSPLINISGVENLTANSRTVSPVIRYSDTNIDLMKSSVTLTSITGGDSRELLYRAKKQGSGYILNVDPIETDDNYILTAKIYDKAGNMTKEQVNFSVNKNGATFKFKPEELVGKYTNKAFYPVIEIWNTDEISIVSATINGSDVPYEFVEGEVRFKNPIDKDGKYIFNLEVSDTAGNINSMQPVEIVYDCIKPVNIISGAKEGESYKGNVKIILSTQLPEDFIDSIWLNEKKLKENEYIVGEKGIELNITEAGEQILKVKSMDRAGNISDISGLKFTIKPKGISAAAFLPAIFALLIGLPFYGYCKKNKKIKI